jgi:GT2 family glycosyltransferase
MKLSVVIICWNDWKVLENCLRSIFRGTHKINYEVIVSDNGSTDGSVEKIRHQFPLVRIVENGANLGFARGNNAGIRAATGQYILILNPDTIVHEGSLDYWVEWADQHPEAGAFGCRVHNLDGSRQESARPFPTSGRYLIAALCLRPLAILDRLFVSDRYYGWKGDTERDIDWQSGCCVMFRGDLLTQLGGFDEQFFYHFEEVDLCRRVWQAGYSIRYTPKATITHLVGQSVGRFPIRYALETYRNRYRYFYKHFGRQGVQRCRRVSLIGLRIRRWGYRVLNFFRPTDTVRQRLEMYRAVILWNQKIDPINFVEHGCEPQMDQATIAQTS